MKAPTINTDPILNTRYEEWKKTRFEAGQKFRANIPFGEDYLVHINHVLPSLYENRQLIIYSVYGRHKQWWHEFMCTNVDMCSYIYQTIKHNEIIKP
jgi:hypothetical protein